MLKTNWMPRFHLFITTFVIGSVISAHLNAQDTFTWSGLAKNTNWNDAGNWNGPSSGTFPADGDTATFDIDANASGGSVLNFNNSGNFLLDGLGDTNQITVADGGSINNTGTISFAVDGFSTDTDGETQIVIPGFPNTVSNPDGLPLGTIEQQITINGQVTLQGAGTVDLQGTLTGFKGGSGSILTNNSTVRVRPVMEIEVGGPVGGGTLSGLEFKNQNLIEIDHSLFIVHDTYLDNSGGVIEVNRNFDTFFSEVDVTGGSTLSGGVLRSGSDGVPAANDSDRTLFPLLAVRGTLRDVTIEGTWELSGSSFVDASPSFSIGSIEGRITNRGLIQAFSSISIAGGTTLDGNGVLLLGDNDGLQSRFPLTKSREPVTNEVGHTISGMSGVLDSIPLENRGTVNANNGFLRFEDVALNSTGTLAASDDGILEQNGGQVIATSIDIATGGAYDLNSGRLEVKQFNGDFFQDGGTFSPDAGVGQANLTGNYTINTGATFEIELAGSQQGQFDQLNVGGDVNLLGGALSVVAKDGFSVSSGDVFDIVSVGGTQSGDFLGLSEGSTIGGLGEAFSITYLAGDGNDIALVSTLTPGSVNFAVAGFSDVAYVFNQRLPDGTSNQTIEVAGLDILPGGEFTLGPLETLNLDDGNGTLCVSEGATFTGNGIVDGNILNKGLVRIPVVPLTQVFGGYVEVVTPEVVEVTSPVVVNESTVAVFTTPSTSIQGAPVVVEGTLALDADLEVTGSYTQTDTGALRLFIGGDRPGVTYSQLIVGEEVVLDGELQLVIQPELFGLTEYTFDLNDTFDFIVADGGITIAEGLSIQNFVTAAGASAFSGFTLSEYDSGISSDPDDLFLIDEPLFMFELANESFGTNLLALSLAGDGTILRATVIATTAIPEPGSLYLLALAGVAVGTHRQRCSLYCEDG